MFRLFLLTLLPVLATPVARPQTLSVRAVSSQHAVPVAQIESTVIRVPVIDREDIRFEHMPSGSGISQTRTSQIIQDARGFLWFGTQAGIDRYDGYEFRSFTHDPRRSDSLSGAFVQSLFKDRNGEIWVGTDQSLDKFDPATESFAHFHVDDHEPTVFQITEDELGLLWLATSRGLYRLNPGTRQVVHYFHDPNDSYSLSGNNVQSTGQDHAGTFWVVTSVGLDAFDRARGKVTLHVPLPGFDFSPYCESSCRRFHEDRFGMFWITGDDIAILDLKTSRLTRFEGESSSLMGLLAVLEDDDGTMWFGARDGLLKFDRTNNRFIHYRRSLTVPTSPAENHVITLFEDREKTIWVGFGGTLPDHFASARPEFEQFLPVFDDPASPGENLVGAIFQDRKGGVWISANEIVTRTDRVTGKRVRYHPGVPGEGSAAIIEDNAGTIWLGAGERGLSRLDRKTGQFRSYKHLPGDPSRHSADYVMRILIDRSGGMWVTTLDGLSRFDPTTGRFAVYKQDPGKPEAYFSLIEDRKGIFWLGSQSGLVQFIPSTGHFAVFEHNSADPRSLSDNVVNTVFEDGLGSLWIGTQDGLNKLDPGARGFTSFYKKDGLAGNVVSCILGDDQGDLWMSTNEGISSFNPRTLKFRNYSVEDGLPGNDLTGMDACYKSPTGEMFFGGFAGAIAFFPDQLKDNLYVPQIVFTDLQMSQGSVNIGPNSQLKRSITYADDLRFSHEQNFFSVEFSALSFRSPLTNRYRYRLEPLDSDWHELDSQQRTVNFRALPSGGYTMLVQGATRRGAWSEPARLRFTVLPPWWNTLWFRIFYGILICCAAWSTYLYRLRQITQEFNGRLEARVSERIRLARDLHDTLLQSFQGVIFRLQAVQELLLPGRGKEQLEQILERADRAVAEGRSAVYELRTSSASDNLAQAITDVANQLAGEDSPTFRLEVEGTMRDMHSILRDEVYGIAREGLRNAFSHARARRVEVDITYDAQLFRLRIRDDGGGIAPELLEAGRPGHYGLSGMRERARLVGAKLEIWSGVGKGTEIDLTIPGPLAYTASLKRSRLRLFRGHIG